MAGSTEEATVYVDDFDVFVTMMLLEDSPAVLSLCSLCEDIGCSHEWKKGESPSLRKAGKMIGCKSENHVAVAEEARLSDVPAKGDRLRFPGVQATKTGRTRFHKGFNLSKKASLVNPQTHTIVVVEQLVVGPREKTPEDMRVNSEEESADLRGFAEKTKRPNTSKSTGEHNAFTHFPQDPICEVCKLAKAT